MIMKTFHLIVSVLLLVTAASFDSYTQQVWNLDQCIYYAWDNNLTIRSQELGVKITKRDYLQANNDLLPSISAQTSLNQYFGRSIDPNTNAYVDVTFFNNAFGIYSAVDIFSGFMKLNTVAMERQNFYAEKNRLQQVKNEVAFSIINGYFDVLMKEGLSSIAQENFQLSRDQLDYTTKLVEVGRKAGTDLLEIEANLAADSFLLVQATHMLVQSSLDLKYEMNYPLGNDLDVDTVIFSIFSNAMDSLSMDELFNIAAEALPDLKLAGNELLAAKKAVSIRKGAFSPSVGFYAGWNTAYTETNRDATNKIIPFPDQFSNNSSEYVSLGIQIPIFSKLSRYTSLSKSRLQYQQAKVAYDDQANMLLMGVEKSLTDWRSARAEYESSLKQLVQSEKAFEAAEKKLAKGLLNIIDFYIQKNKVFRAKTEVLRTGLQVLLKERYIRFLMTGSLLENA